jgi:holo-[acyl-carrier protein] synthase
MRDRIGVDIVSVARVQALLDLHGSELARRLLTERELRDSTGAQGLLAHSVAGRIAAKEAVFKLFHEGTALLPWMHIAVVRGPSGAPLVRLTGRALTLAEASRLGPVSLSTSHDEGYAIAFATAALMSGTTPESVRPDGPSGG